MVLGLLRALVAGGLVEQNQRLGVVGPQLAAHAENQALFCDRAIGVVADRALQRDLSGDDQPFAFAARAEALGKQNLR